MSFSQQLLAEAIKGRDNTPGGDNQTIYIRLIEDIKSNPDKYDKYNGPLNAKDLCWKLYKEIFAKPYSECINSFFPLDKGNCYNKIPNKSMPNYVELVDIPRNAILNTNKEAFSLHKDPFVFAGKDTNISSAFMNWLSVILILIILILLILPVSSTIKFWGILVSGLILLVREGMEAWEKK